MEKEKLYLFEGPCYKDEKVFEKMEKQFNTIMNALDLQGYCHIKYEEEHPEHANYSGMATCSGSILDNDFTWTVDHRPAAETAEEFINRVKVRLFDMAADAADTYVIAHNR